MDSTGIAGPTDGEFLFDARLKSSLVREEQKFLTLPGLAFGVLSSSSSLLEMTIGLERPFQRPSFVSIGSVLIKTLDLVAATGLLKCNVNC